VRTKAMALVGISIGLMFALALVAAPLLAAQFGLAGLFWLTFGLAVAGMATVLWWCRPQPRSTHGQPGRLADVLRNPTCCG
jgi:predicted MFS family arabinose efflux permease